MQRRIQNHVKHLRWRILQRKPFSQNPPSQMFDKVLNTPLICFVPNLRLIQHQSHELTIELGSHNILPDW